MPYAFPTDIAAALKKLSAGDLAELLIYARTNGAESLVNALTLRYGNYQLEIHRQKYKNVGKVKIDPDNPPPIEKNNPPEISGLAQEKKYGRKAGFKVSAATRAKMSRAKRLWWAQKKKNLHK